MFIVVQNFRISNSAGGIKRDQECLKLAHHLMLINPMLIHIWGVVVSLILLHIA